MHTTFANCGIIISLHILLIFFRNLEWSCLNISYIAIICPKKEMLTLNGQYIPHCSCINDDKWSFDLQMMMMMMNCFCGMVDWRKAFSLISSWDHCQRSSPSRISDMLQAGFEPVQNLSSGFLEWSCAVVITTTP